MTDVDRIVIVGGGVAAGSAAARLRETGWGGDLTVVTDEQHPPYERPPLSKSVLIKGADPTTTYVRPKSWYHDEGVTLRLCERAIAIDAGSRSLRTTGHVVPYDRLLIATGSSPRPLDRGLLRGGHGPTMTYLRTIDDSLLIRSAIEHEARIAIIGGGWIALEIAAAARTWGCEVIIIERGRLPLEKVLGPRIAQRFLDLHHEHAATILTGASVASVEAGERVARVRLADGALIEVDLLVVGVGAVPNVELAPPGIVATAGGIDTNEFLQTKIPGVYAAGDVARPYHPRYGEPIRVDHWDNAVQQGEHAAANMLGRGTPYDRIPYFFTDQYDLGMEYVGYVPPGTPTELVVHGDVRSDAFTAFWTYQERVLAGMHVNSWDAMSEIRAVVEDGAVARLKTTVTPTP